MRIEVYCKSENQFREYDINISKEQYDAFSRGCLDLDLTNLTKEEIEFLKYGTEITDGRKDYGIIGEGECVVGKKIKPTFQPAGKYVFHDTQIREIHSINSEPYPNELDCWSMKVRLKVGGVVLDYDTIFLSKEKSGFDIIEVGKKYYGDYWGIMEFDRKPRPNDQFVTNTFGLIRI